MAIRAVREGMKSGAKSRLGQNFLIDTGAQSRIVAALGDAAGGTVVEIGPGGAAITSLLAARARRLVAIELDSRLAVALRERFAATASVEIVEDDVLRVDLSALADGLERSLAVVGNLPYYITSPILTHLFAHERVCSRAVVMVQREVALRMTAEPGTRAYGLLSVLCRVHAELSYLFTLPPSAFQPAPQVESAVVRLEFRPRWRELGIAPEPFGRFLRSAFAQKRKTLSNNLRAAGCSDAAIAAAFAQCGLGLKTRAEELSPDALAAVSRALGSVQRSPA